MNNKQRKRKMITSVIIFSIFLTITVFGGSNIIAGFEKEFSKINDEASLNTSPIDNDLTANADSFPVTELSEWDDNYGEINDLFVQGNRLYLALGPEGFIVYDITNLNPQIISSWDDQSCSSLYVVGDYVYAANTSGFNLVDISDTNNPSLICNWTGLGTGKNDIAAEGNFVYLVDDNEFIIVNITELNNPFSIYDPNNGLQTEIHLVNGYAYVNNEGLDDVYVYNVTDPNEFYGLEDTLPLTNINDIFFSQDFIYYSNVFQVNIGNATEPDNLQYITDVLTNDTCISIGVKDDRLIVNEKDRFEIFDFDNKTNPQYLYQYIEPRIPMEDFVIDGNYIFAYNNFAVEIFDISDLANIQSAYLDILNGFSVYVHLQGNYAYIADQTSLEILDISNPANPKEVGYYYDPDGGAILGVFARNNYLYLIENDGGDTLMVILSITNPSNPVYQGNITVTGATYDVYVDNEYAYLAQGAAGVAIVDIFYPDLPQKSLQYDEHGSVWSLEKIGNNLVLVTNQYLHVIDVSNAYNPQQISNFTRTGAGYDYIDIQSNYGYVICDEGFEVIDFTNVLNPVKVGQYFNYEDPTYLEVDGRYVYLLDLNDGITFYDVTNKAHPKLLGSYDDNRDHNTLTARNGYIYLAEGDYGTRILRTPYISLKASLNVIYCIAGFVLFSVIGLLWQKTRKK